MTHFVEATALSGSKLLRDARVIKTRLRDHKSVPQPALETAAAIHHAHALRLLRYTLQCRPLYRFGLGGMAGISSINRLSVYVPSGSRVELSYVRQVSPLRIRRNFVPATGDAKGEREVTEVIQITPVPAGHL